MKTSLVLLIPMILCLAACGAEQKSASDVKSIFEVDVAGLDDKVIETCDGLKDGTMAEAAGRLKFSLDYCDKDIGDFATELTSPDGLYFHPETSTTKAATDETFIVSNRVQVWVGRSLLDMGAVILAKMREGADDKAPLDGRVLSETKVEEIMTIKLSLAGEPVIDLENYHVSQGLHIVSSGLVEIDLTAQVDFALDNGHIAAVISTTDVGKDSFLKNVSAALFVVPHASDIYVDSFVSLELVSVGYTTLLKREISSILSAGINTAIKQIKELNGPAS